MSNDHRAPRPGISGIARASALAAALITGTLLPSSATPVSAQVRTPATAPPASAIGDTVTVVPAPEYAAGRLRRTLFGSGWRSVWLTPVDVQVFGLEDVGDGVEWSKRGGGNQSITLHLDAENDWREYIFRSVNKFPQQALPPSLVGTPIGTLVDGMIASLFPAAPLMVPPFLDAVDILHVEPVLRVVSDDPRLGVYQDTFAGMLGTVELQPNEAPGDEPGFAGSSKIKGTEQFFEDLEESKGHRLDEREFLRARLVDFLINDTDRTRDNMRWARYGEKGDYRWRTLPTDRDWAFVNAEGWITSLARGVYPKLAEFGPEFPPITALTYSSYLLDRRLLQRLTRDDFSTTAAEVQAAITDEVIEAAIAQMPERWRTETDAPDQLREALRSRRSQLPEIALAFHDYLATDVDIRGTDEPERAVIERHADGRVRVTITWPDDSPRAGELFYDRTFLPSLTSEIRLYLHGGDDEARIIGAGSPSIRVRVIGGGGDDLLADEAGGGATHLYDSRGDNEITAARRTHVSTRKWNPPQPTEGLRVGMEWAPDWGGGIGWSPYLDYGDVAGVIIGFGPSWTSYGFRRLPYHWRLGARLLYAVGDNSFGVEVDGDYRLENSPLALTLAASARPFDAFRFNGYGNDTPDRGDAALVKQERIAVLPALTWHIGWRERVGAGLVTGPNSPQTVEDAGLRPLVGRLDVGPIFLYTDPHPEPLAPLVTRDPLGARSLARAGLRTAVTLDRTDEDAIPRHGWRARASAAGYPGLGDLSEPFAEASGELAAYLPILGLPPHLAVRAGGSGATGEIPVQHTPWIGGRTTVRGYRWQRFRGDAAAFGSAELRVPVMPVELLLRWDTGVFGLVDAGRVWVDGRSPGGWHTGYGGGVWMSALGNVLSAAYARGEEDRLYLQLALSF